MVRLITFDHSKIWLFIEQLHVYNDERSIVDTEEYVCYFKFSEPNPFLYGEILRDPNTKHPLTFKSVDAAETYAVDYLENRYSLPITYKEPKPSEDGKS